MSEQRPRIPAEGPMQILYFHPEASSTMMWKLLHLLKALLGFIRHQHRQK